MPDFIFGLTPGDIIFDCETYPNTFTLHAVHADTGQEWSFDQSQLGHVRLFMDTLASLNCRMVGFNNIGFDYPVLHFIHAAKYCTVADIYSKAMAIITGDRFAHTVWPSDWLVQQLDLFKIHHFDNVARATSLKVLEFNMRSDSVEDLPFPVGTVLSPDQVAVLKQYNRHDVLQTLKFYRESLPQIRFREELTAKYQHDFMNHNDTKIGKDYFVMRLEEHAPGTCYDRSSGRRMVRQTKRASICLADVILPTVRFDRPEFNRILQWFKSQIITETKGVFKDISATVDGFTFDFGTGGIHGSVESQTVTDDDQWIIEDWDVTSYYPTLAIVNRLHPLHLGTTFCDIYADVFEQRKQYPKGSAENAMLKLALNGVYGDSNNQYSPFYDPQYTMSITINGQLLLCMLAESLMRLDSLQMIQANTDGITVRYPRQHQQWVHSVCQWWEQTTGLTLESAEYSHMFIRDVNNYLARYTDGKVKRKGAYEYELGWHQNHSALVVPMGAEAYLLHGTDPSDFVMNHADPFDFYLRAKVPRNTILQHGGTQVANIVRYYISTDGLPLEKVMPPAGPAGAFKRKNGISDLLYQTVLAEIGDAWDERIHTKNKSRYEERRTGINTGWLTTIHNQVQPLKNVAFDWYVQEIEKLTKVM